MDGRTPPQGRVVVSPPKSCRQSSRGPCVRRPRRAPWPITSAAPPSGRRRNRRPPSNRRRTRRARQQREIPRPGRRRRAPRRVPRSGRAARRRKGPRPCARRARRPCRSGAALQRTRKRSSSCPTASGRAGPAHSSTRPPPTVAGPARPRSRRRSPWRRRPCVPLKVRNCRRAGGTTAG